MSKIEVESVGDLTRPERSGWHELWRKEDWWAIWLGLAIVIVGYLLFANDVSLRWVAVTPAKWSSLGQLAAHFGANIWRYIVQLLLWLAVFTAATGALGFKSRDFVAAFMLLYILSVATFAIGQWSEAATFNLEPPLVALVAGLAISNLVGLPH
jgi:hypothetical protein